MTRLIKIVGDAASGGAGAATASTDSAVPISGLLMSVYIQYNDSPPATSDVTISTKGGGNSEPSHNLLVVSNANTDGRFYPRASIVDTSNTAPATAVWTPIPIDDFVNVAITQANDGDSVTVWLLLE